MSTDVNMGKLLKLRAQINEMAPVRISVNDLVIKAMGLASVDVPDTNSHWLGDKIRQFENVDVSVAVATESGLITPIVTNANNKSISQIA